MSNVSKHENKHGTGRSGAVDSLVITFDGLKEMRSRGVTLGTDPKVCHILLGCPGTQGVSAIQYYIAVDASLRIWLCDQLSAHGTAVGHYGQNQTAIRRNERWILAFEPGLNYLSGPTTLHSGIINMQIEFPNHSVAHPMYINSLRAFAQSCKLEAAMPTELQPLGGFGLDSHVASGMAFDAQILGQGTGNIYYQEKIIGTGEFGEVSQAIRARDGLIVAAKGFWPQKRDRTWLPRIVNEFTVMRDNRRPNIAEVFELSQMSTNPTIFMEYYPDGNMADFTAASKSQRITGFGQVLSALEYLHQNGVVHRDLKPENFLVKLEPYFKVVITDFGSANVARNNAWLRTFCDSASYAVPEVFPGTKTGYGTLADIWSMGVIGMEWVYRLPEIPDLGILADDTDDEEDEEYEGSEGFDEDSGRNRKEYRERKWQEWNKSWAESLSFRLYQEYTAEDPLIGIVYNMLVAVSKRWPASKCLTQGLYTAMFTRRYADGLIECTEYMGNL